MLNPITIRVLPEFTGFNEKSATNYYKAKERINFLKDYVVTPFESKLKEKIGYNKQNLPEKRDVFHLNLGDYIFEVINETRQKKPQSKKIFENINNYFSFLNQQYNEGIRRKDIFTKNDRAYTTLNHLLQKIEGFRNKVLENDLKQTIIYKGPEEYSDAVIVAPESKIQLNDSGAILYTNSQDIIQKLKVNTLKPFEDKLKSQTHYNKDNIPEKKEDILAQAGDFLFKISVIPEQTVSYAKIFKALTKEGKRVTKTTGELILLRDGFDLDEKIKEFYQPLIESRTTYISIPGIMERMQSLKQDYTKPSVNIRVAHHPISD